MRSSISLLSLLIGCVAYRPAPVDLPALDAEVRARTAPPLDYEAAVRHADAWNPRLAALLHEAGAAGLDVPATMADIGPNHELSMLGATIDPLAAAKLGPRGAASRAAAARRLEALARLLEERRRVCAEIAEVFAVERALGGRGAPEVPVDPSLFERAGLAAPVAAEHVRHARRAAEAEGQAVRSTRAANLARLRRLLGLSPHAEVVIADGVVPAPPEAAPERLLRRPDLAVALARYRVADAEFRQAVWEQYPTLRIGPTFEIDSGGWKGFAAISIPIGATARARAAGERREAARRAVEADLLVAQEEAATRAAERAEARARARAAEAAAAASRATLDAALTRLELEPDAFEGVADAAVMAVADAAMDREAAVALAVAEVRHSSAWAWPLPRDTVPGTERRGSSRPPFRAWRRISEDVG